MPTYEYICKTCDYRFEKFQSMNDEPVKTCPECGNQVKKLIGTGTCVIFKGHGFYTTDYKNKSSGGTCCGRTEQCDRPPCSDNGTCKR